MNQERATDRDIRGTGATDLTIEDAWNVGKALADQLPTAGKVIVVSIATQKELARALIEGLRLQGRDVIDGGYGDQALVCSHVADMHLAGGAMIAFDDVALTSTIALFDEKAQRIDSHNGLVEICELVGGGNFVPAATKGELTVLV